MLCMQASARQQGKMTEAQLRAAASVASKRADDEALYAHQKVTELKQQLGRQQVSPLSSALLVMTGRVCGLMLCGKRSNSDCAELHRQWSQLQTGLV